MLGGWLVRLGCLSSQMLKDHKSPGLLCGRQRGYVGNGNGQTDNVT